ncbi:hypothetical protein D4764_09G0000270 [Takifugu flavidus]|uniref:Uncharacterized protein n=1 Tax=Takifugu flavidus TaxID=433684 RepID=A0A5C6MKA7_9TELE|nr:hypothetical protein D4764_09G0000270 [Takifugu flavidus]
MMCRQERFPTDRPAGKDQIDLHNIRKKEHEKLEKYEGLKEEIERMWGMKATVVPVVIGTLGAVTPNLSRWPQQIPGTTSEISVQKSAVLGTAKILRRTLRLPGLW